MKYERLLAKSLPQGVSTDGESNACTLRGHSENVLNAATTVLACTGEQQLRAVGLDPEEYRERFQRIVLLASALHDLGKANEHFQQMVRRERLTPQGLRHEWITYLLVREEPLQSWLRNRIADDFDWYAVLWAVSGHHPKYGRPSPPRFALDGTGNEVRIFVDHSDFLDTLQWIGDTFGLDTPVPRPLLKSIPLVGRENAFSRLFKDYLEDKKCWDDYSRHDARDLRRLVAAVKLCLIGADVAGSSLPRKFEKSTECEGWVRDAFSRVPKFEQLSEIIESRLGTETLRPFQELVGESTSDITFVKAGCGSGKTLAAYHWARTQYPNRRVYLCYPTTGTATEGFRDYLWENDAPRHLADLFHGRASIDLEILESNDEDINRESDSFCRIEALDAWSTPIVCCTVDTVLGLIQNNRRGLYAWPALAGSVFVFDEIHAYDDKLFGALLRFLADLPGVPALLMSASLPRARWECLQRTAERNGRSFQVVHGPPEFENRPRYHRREAVDSTNVLETIRQEFDAGGRVLWVCNTVDRAISAWNQTKDLSPLIYHSRFRYEDRVKKHESVVEAFKTNAPALAICTQVAEMSLDLSATLLVSDLAPVPSLIQRLGRLNRQGNQGADAGGFIILEPIQSDGTPQTLPYTPSDFEMARNWLATLPESGISQADLASAWEELDASRRPAAVTSAWLDGGPMTQVLELRAASPGITVLLDNDVKNVRAGIGTWQRYAIPMPPPPRDVDWRQWPPFNGIPVLNREQIDYCPQRGARWQRKAE